MTIEKSSSNRFARLQGTIKAILAARWFPALAALIAFALGSPALTAGFRLDDYFHRVILLQDPRFRELDRTPREMFRFMRGERDEAMKRMELGTVPWWMDPEIKAEFLQAVTVETHILDYRLWPNSPMLMHAHSLVWLSALVFGVGILARRVIGPTWVAGLAALLFAIDEAHGTEVGWLANRNSLVAATFGVLSVIALDAWRRERRLWGAIASPLLLATSLFSKEEGIATCAYLFAYAVCLDPRGARKGVLSLIPHALVVVAWRLIRGYLGYGVAYLGLYIDPLGEPALFLKSMAVRAPLLFFSLWTPIPCELDLALSPKGRWVLLGTALLSIVWLAVAFSPLLRRDRLARFWALGMLLAIVPVCATLPSNRLLTAPSIGSAGLLALFLVNAFQPSVADPRTRGWRAYVQATAWALVLFHLVLAPMLLLEKSGNPLGPKSLEKRLSVELPMDRTVENQTVVLVNPPLSLYASYLSTIRQLRNLPVPKRVRMLSSGMPEVTITRVDDKTIVIRPEPGFLYWPYDELFRTKRRALRLGERVTLTGMTAEVKSLTADGRPSEVAFHFDVPLEDASLRWICYKEGSYRDYRPPALGKSETIRIGGLGRILLGD